MTTDTAEQLKAALLDAVVDLAEHRQGPGGASVAGELLRHYFDRVPAQDLSGKDPIDLYASTIRHLQLAERRVEPESPIQIYNPNSDEDGWASSHTVIDVVGKDMPFIVDSVLALLERLGHQIHVLIHPMFDVQRGPAGELVSVSVPGSESTRLESTLHVEIDRIGNPEVMENLERELAAVLSDVRAAVEDWIPMRERVRAIADELDRWATEADSGTARFISEVGGEPREVADLLRWMESGSFVFTGYREYDFFDDPQNPRIVSRPATGLGTLRQTEPMTRSLGDLPPETIARSREPRVLNLTKANGLSTVHRAVPLDYIGIKEIDAEGRVTGERRILGLFTSNVYVGQVGDIPSVRVKVKAVTETIAFARTTHDYNRLLNVLQTFPRDELFQIDVDQLETMALAILDMRDRRQVSLLVRRDTYGRFVSCLVFVPRDRHSTQLRHKIQQALMEMYEGTSVRYSTEISNAPLARLHLVIYTDPRPAGELPDPAAVQARLVQLSRTWDDYLRATLIDAHGEAVGLDLLSRYGSAFDASYREHVLAESAVHDIERLERLARSEQPGKVDVFLHRPLEASRFELRCKILCSDQPIVLSRLIPLFHDLGAVVIDERPFEVEPVGSSRKFIYDIGLEMSIELDSDDRARVRDALLAVWNGDAESDSLAQLTVTAAATWLDVTVLRAYSRYLVQIGVRHSFSYIADALNHNPAIAAGLIELFHIRFDPATASEDRPARQTALVAELSEAIDQVASLDADQILRALRTAISATVRTNHWQTDAAGRRKPAFVIKLDPRSIPDLPKPVPAAELFVYSPRTEGVHLRSGRVARGGIRWSERMEDYRTEVLGLMKAQTVKNSVIVPVGAKGGFIARHLPPSGTRDEIMAEVVACYETFIGGMLDVTDNIVDDRPAPPLDVLCHDEPDPYLVVAADKGTATFSDIANRIAVERGFWLGDAFASGGSAGYDHKALAITARGTWVSVLSHFRELGLSVDAPFTMAGIGDMSGDVFGNGLLRSRQACLVAAFDHRHVFIDPQPDPTVGFDERARLFALPRSSWDDYNRDLISAGGGIFPRSAKAIPVSAEIAHALGIDNPPDYITPDALIRAVLQAPVDLLWNGGIGTYIKASNEAHLDVGDRSNDNVRVDASELRCKVVAEGGNLGVSQRGRIEYATAGGRINTDAIDNSGGVDCSDHEVNLKILLTVAERNGDMTRKQRNQLLASMADQVCDHLLENNDAQNRTLTAAVAEAPGMVQVHERLMTWLEQEASLDRTIELLPSTREMSERHDRVEGLTRPELAVLLAYTKNTITEQLAAGPLPANATFDELILAYFPPQVRDAYRELILAHPLRTELVATLLSNQVVNRGGISMVHRLKEETSATISDICLAHFVAWKIYDLDPLWVAAQSFGPDVSAFSQLGLELEITKLGERATRWLLRNEPQPLDAADVIERYRPSILALQSRLAEVDEVASSEATEVTEVTGRLASLGAQYGFLDLATVGRRTQQGLADVATTHRLLDEALGLAQLRDWVVGLPRDDHWQTLARGAFRDQFFAETAELTATVISSLSQGASPSDHVDRWLSANVVATDRFRRTLSDIAATPDRELAHVSVALRALSQLRRSI